MPATVASAWCSTTSPSPSRTWPRPSASTAPSSPCWGSSPATRTTSSSSGRTGTSGPQTASTPCPAACTSGSARRAARQWTPFGRRGSTPATATTARPGRGPEYGPDYYGGFLRDPDGNSAEAVHDERARPVPDGRIDHLWIRVADLAASSASTRPSRPTPGSGWGKRSQPRAVLGRGLQLLAGRRRGAAHRERPPRLPRPRGRHGARVPRRRRRRGLRGPRRSGGAHRVPPRLLRRVRPGPHGHNLEGVNHNR